MNKAPLVELISSKGLRLLATVISAADNDELAILLSHCKHRTGIDLEMLPVLTESDVEKIKKFEAEQLDLFLNNLLKSKENPDGPEAGEKTDNRFLRWFGFAVTGAAIIYIYLITWIAIPEQNIRFADTALGFIQGSLLSPVMGFFFGDSFRKITAGIVKKK